LGTGLANHPTLTSTWPCEPSALARTVQQALDATDLTQPLQQAVVTLNHPQLMHTPVTAMVELADEPVAIRSRDLVRLRAQALAQALSLDRELLHLESLGYSANGFDRVLDPRGLAATRLRGAFHLVSVPLAVRQAVGEAIEAVGLEIARWSYSLEAVVAACLDDSLSKQRSLVIDVGGSSTQVGLVVGGVIARSLTIPWGGMTLASAVAKTCRLTLEQALSVSLEGPASPKPKVRQLIGQQLLFLQRGIHQLLKGEPQPDLTLVTGRGALIDGLVEWVEMATETNTVLGRSPRAKGLGDLSRQVALTPALGLLELAFRMTPSSLRRSVPNASPSGMVDRLIDRTKTLLTEYF